MPPALPLNLQVDPGALTSGSAVSDSGSELHVSRRIKVFLLVCHDAELTPTACIPQCIMLAPLLVCDSS